MFDKITRNKFGFFELTDKPTELELKQYYSKKYYQESKGVYQKDYSEDELLYMNNKIAQKHSVISNYLNLDNEEKVYFLDVGCGEGWALEYFTKEGWEVLGLDYSKYGCETQNPECLEKVQIGEITDNINLLIEAQRYFQVVWLDNVLEHVLDPLLLLQQCKSLLSDNGVLVIEVPNDFSVIQQQLYEKGYIAEPFWVALPDHISYFNSDGLNAICNEVQLECIYLMGDFPIDFNLFNENTNYVNNNLVGKSCHKARVAIENILHKISLEKTNELYRKFAELGLGRQIIGFYQQKEK